jgi:hypothetical protein
MLVSLPTYCRIHRRLCHERMQRRHQLRAFAHRCGNALD